MDGPKSTVSAQECVLSPFIFVLSFFFHVIAFLYPFQYLYIYFFLNFEFVNELYKQGKYSIKNTSMGKYHYLYILIIIFFIIHIIYLSIYIFKF